MSFFLSSRLVELEYFTGEPDKEYAKAAESYQYQLDFAFFAVNFGYSKKDYDDLTLTEKALIMKAWENKIVSDSYNVYNATFTAVYNANRSKNKKALKLWKKKATNKADMEAVDINISIVKEVDLAEGRDWIKLVYEANGMKLKKEVEGDG